MKKLVGFLLKIFGLTLLYFVLFKVAFMLVNHSIWRGCSVGDYFAVILHGLPLDITTACYITAPILLLLMVNMWHRLPHLYVILKVYYFLLTLVSTLICVGDACLYSFWDYKIDATIFNYLTTPSSIINSVSLAYLTGGFVCVFAVTGIAYLVLRGVTPFEFNFPEKSHLRRNTLLCVLIGAFMFLGIRGGVGRSTANVGMVYFSSNQFLNHSAVNPVFSLFSSMSKSLNFKKMGRSFPPERCDSIFNALHFSQETVEPDSLLATSRPNVLVVFLEGFAGTFTGVMGNPAGITPNFDRLCREGVFFTNFYANSYRTDRGLLSTLSGYPSFPKVSVMKIPAASQNLPSIGKALRDLGYKNSFLYGGDINFTNMQSYLRSTGYTRIVSDRNFTPAQRLTHGWGVTDSITFGYLLGMIKRQPVEGGKWHTAFLTLASHEPWKVPYKRFPRDKKANAIAYVDHCVGMFINALRHTPQWKNLLVVMMPDHGIAYPAGLTEAQPRRYHIPMLWIGGAVRKPCEVDRICNQSDFAATLLGQMGIKHDNFEFSRDVLSKTYVYPTASHAFDNGIAFIDSTGATVYDLTSRQVLTDEPAPSKRRLDFAKAILQKSYDNLMKIEDNDNEHSYE